MTSGITPLIQRYTVDFASTNNFLFVKGIQGDGHSTRYVDITLLNETQPYLINQDAVEVVIRGTKPDNKSIFNVCEILDNHTIRVEITQQMSAVPGKSSYEISVMDKQENCAITSFPFFIVISKSSFDIGYVVSSDEFGLLIQKINEVNHLNLTISDLIDETQTVISESRSQTEQCRSATEEAIEETDKVKEFHHSAEQAEALRNEKEQKRQSDTAAAITNVQNATRDAIVQTDAMRQLEANVQAEEQKRSDAEKIRIQNAADFIKEENRRKANESNRIAAEEKREADTREALTKSSNATIKATDAAGYANSVANDLINRLNNGELNGKDGKDGKDGVITTIAGQYAFQIENDDLYLYYSEGDQPLDAEIDENGEFIINLTDEGGI